MEYTDIGANLCSKPFAPDLDAVISRARDCGVRVILVTGSNVRESHAAARLAHDYPGALYSTAGVHPHHAEAVAPGWEQELQSLFADGVVRAAGETGLDFNRNYAPREAQIQVFEAQLQLAAASNLPLFMHERDAGKTFRSILAPWRNRIAGGVVHCFTGSEVDLRAYLDLDLYIGITGWICDERRGQTLQRLAAQIPDDRLLVETDAPYLLPRTITPRPRSRRNEPAFLPHVVAALANWRNQSTAHIALITHRNAARLFRLNAADSAPPEHSPNDT